MHVAVFFLRCSLLINFTVFGQMLQVAVCPMLRDRCTVTLVYCGQTVGWLQMPLGVEVGLSPGIVVRWDQLPHGKGHSSLPSLFSPLCSVLWHDHPSQQLMSSC